MTPEDLESLRTRYSNDAEFRRLLDNATTADEAVAICKEHGIDATASELAQLGGGHVELDLATIDQMAGGNVVDDFNFTVN